MSSATGHRIVHLPDPPELPKFCNAGRTKIRPACGGVIEFALQYEYVTGRAGRVATATRYVCREHARKWGIKHDAGLPDLRT